MVFLILIGGGYSTLKGLKRQNTGTMNTSKGLKRSITGTIEDAEFGTLATFVPVKAGTFLMGSPSTEKGRGDDEFQHKVTLTQDFEIQTTEVTQLQYILGIMDGFRPVHSDDFQKFIPKIKKFISRLNQSDEDEGYIYQPPKEAEWKYAARKCMDFGEPLDIDSCTMTAFNLGDDILADQATEMTQRHYLLATISTNPSFFNKKAQCPNDHVAIYGMVDICSNLPVEQVSWNDVQVYISILNRRNDGYTYRLPTEGEWEYAARGCMGSGEPMDMASCTMTAFNLGDDILADQVNYNRRQTVNGSSLPNANGLGLYDMHGNVSEWVEDKYGTYPRSHVVDPNGPSSGPKHVLRGGSYRSGDAQYVRSAYRSSWRSKGDKSDVGFRLVRTANK